MRAIQAAYEYYELEPQKDFVARPIVRGGPIEAEFDFAVRNGSVIQLAQAFSFERSGAERLSEQIAVWGWAVNGLRDDKQCGTVMLENRTVPISGSVDVVVVYVEPVGAEMRHAFEYLF